MKEWNADIDKLRKEVVQKEAEYQRRKGVNEWRSTASKVAYPYNEQRTQEEIFKRMGQIESQIAVLSDRVDIMMNKLFARLEELDQRFTDLTKDQPTPAFRCPECEEVKLAEAFETDDYICKSCRLGE